MLSCGFLFVLPEILIILLAGKFAGYPSFCITGKKKKKEKQMIALIYLHVIHDFTGISNTLFLNAKVVQWSSSQHDTLSICTGLRSQGATAKRWGTEMIQLKIIHDDLKIQFLVTAN